jgi:hypothetical protein
VAKIVSVKWAGPNTPFISLNGSDERLYLSKEELVALYIELNDFIEFYKENFTADRIHDSDTISIDHIFEQEYKLKDD